MSLAERNPHPKDARIEFIKLPGESRGHYYVDGVKWTECGVTRDLDYFFPNTFDKKEVYGDDEEKIKQVEHENYMAACYGNFMSLCHHNFINGDPFEPDPLFPQYKCLDDIPEWKCLQEQMDTLPKSWVPFRSEWPLFSSKLKTVGVPDYVMRDMAFPNEMRLVVIDFKCQVRPFDLPFCNGLRKDRSKRTNCNTSRRDLPESHDENCPAVGKHAMRKMLTYKHVKCGAQMAIYRMLLLECYKFEKELKIDRMVGVYIKKGYTGVRHFYQEDIDQYEEMLDQFVERKLKQRSN